MVRELSSLRPDYVVTTRISDGRGVPEEELAELFMESGCPAVFSQPDPACALQLVRALRGEGIAFCVGSLYLAGELLKGNQTYEF